MHGAGDNTVACPHGRERLLLVLVAGVLFFSRLDAALLEPTEGRNAEVARQMLAEGQFVVPVLHGNPYLDKPPLLYWLVMGSYASFGVHDWAARLLPGTAGVLTVLVVYWWGRRTLGERAGFAGAMVLALTPRFVYFERMLTMDGLLALWTTAGLAFAHAAMTAPALRRGWWFLSAATCGLGLLTKGPIILVLVLIPLLAYRLFDRQTARIGWLDTLAYLAVAAAVAAPWYIAVCVAQPDFASYFFWTHNVRRFVDPLDHEEPVWFYLPGLLLGLFPWVLLLPGLLRLVVTSGSSPVRFVLFAAGWGLLFFSLSSCKRPSYVLPVMPPLALALGSYLAVAFARRTSRLAWVATSGMLLGGVAVIGLSLRREMLALETAVALASAAVAGLVWLGVRAVRRGPVLAWQACGGVTFAALLGGVVAVLPGYNRLFAVRDQLGEESVVACYPQRWDSATFYRQDADVRVYTPEDRDNLVADLTARPGTLVLLRSGRAVRELAHALPAGLELVAEPTQASVTAARVRRRE